MLHLKGDSGAEEEEPPDFIADSGAYPPLRPRAKSLAVVAGEVETHPANGWNRQKLLKEQRVIEDVMAVINSSKKSDGKEVLDSTGAVPGSQQLPQLLKRKDELLRTHGSLEGIEKYHDLVCKLLIEKKVRP